MTDAAPHHSRKGLIIPFAIVAVALAGWTGWWFFLTQQIEQRLEGKIAGLQQSGWTIKHGGVSTTGWPMHARVTIKHLDVVAPSGHAVEAPEMVAQANAYNPTRWVLAAPDGLTVTRAQKGKTAIRAEGIRMSLHGLTQRWPNVVLELEKPVFTALPDAEPFPLDVLGAQSEGMIGYVLEQELGMDRAIAYAYLSAAADFTISQVVDRTVGVHGIIAKSHFA